MNKRRKNVRIEPLNIPCPDTTLLHPALEATKAMVGKKGSTYLATSQWDEDTLKPIVAFIRSGNLEALQQEVFQNPFIASHPVVLHQMFHLRKLVRTMDEREFWERVDEGESLNPEQTVISSPLKQQAQKQLHALLSVFVESMCPGHTVQPKTRNEKPGPKKRPTLYVMNLLDECQELLKKMASWHPREFKRQPKESEEDFIERTNGLVSKLHHGYWYSRRPIASSSKDLMGIKQHSTCLPAEVERKMMRYARRKTKVSQRPLVYAYLAHFHQKTPTAIRHIIEENEADLPKHVWMRT